MKYAVRWMDEKQEEEQVEFFKDIAEAKSKIASLIEEATGQAQEYDGKIPNWVYEVTLLQVLGDVELGYDGLHLKMRKP